MKMLITEKDVHDLSGKFIVQINSNAPDTTITEENWNFMQEKRISFVCALQLVGFYYVHRNFNSAIDFVEYFNNYDEKNTRFHRLLTSKELDFVNKKIKQGNY